MSINQTVHIIDDDPSVCQSIRLVLTEEGIDAKTYQSAPDFLGMISPDDVGCVVTDVRMPGMNGVDLLAHIMEHGLYFPVIVMTGQADAPLAVLAMKQGAVDFMEKPFCAEALIASVRKALAHNSGRKECDEASQKIRLRLETLSVREQEVLERRCKVNPTKSSPMSSA